MLSALPLAMACGSDPLGPADDELIQSESKRAIPDVQPHTEDLFVPPNPEPGLIPGPLFVPPNPEPDLIPGPLFVPPNPLADEDDTLTRTSSQERAASKRTALCARDGGSLSC